eukprot:3575048-Amphidinium_carterae.1
MAFPCAVHPIFQDSVVSHTGPIDGQPPRLGLHQPTRLASAHHHCQRRDYCKIASSTRSSSATRESIYAHAEFSIHPYHAACSPAPRSVLALSQTCRDHSFLCLVPL